MINKFTGLLNESNFFIQKFISVVIWYCVIVVFASILFFSCKISSQNDAKDLANGIQNSVAEYTPGNVPTSSDGFYRKATINGKEWIAKDMMPPERLDRIIGYNGEEYISLPYERRNILAGNKTNFKNDAIDISLNDDFGIWGGHSVEMEITNVDDTSAEGKFHLTADGLQTDKKLQLTDGSFRILFSDK